MSAMEGGVEVSISTFSLHHIDAQIVSGEEEEWRFTGY